MDLTFSADLLGRQMEPTDAGNSSSNPSSSPTLTVRSNRPMRMAGFACLVVLLTAVYVGFDVNQAVGQNRNLYDIAIPASRTLSDIEYEMQEARHSMMHANSALVEATRASYLADFAARSQRVSDLTGKFLALRVPPPIRARFEAWHGQWQRYLAISPGGVDHSPSSPGPALRDRQFGEAIKASRQVHDNLDGFSRSSAGAVRMAFVRAGFELVLLLLGTLHMIAVLATNGEKRKAFESLRVLNQRLQVARAAAEESSKLKSEFLATVSHEIRTPMNGIIGMAELLSRSLLNEEQKSYNETVRVSAEALLSILNDILDFSRIEAGKLVIDSTPFTPSDPAFQMADLLAPAAAQKGLEFVVRADPNLPRTVLGDAGRVRQVLMNLAGNSIKFTHSGYVKVEVSAIETSALQCRIRFSVRDTGIGIPQNKLTRLFEKFTQADSSTTRKYGGTGLGLAISSKLVELMNGSIEVESEDGVGSNFFFDVTLPVADASPEVRAPFAETHPKVLVIEPSEVSATSITEMLASLGAAPRCTLSAAEGVEILEAGASQWQAVLISSRVQVVEPALFVRVQRLLGKGSRLIVLAPRGRVDPKLAAREVRVVSKPLQSHTLEEALRAAIYERPARVIPATLLRRSDAEVSSSATQDIQQLAKSVDRVMSSGVRVLVAEDNVVNQTIVRKLLEDVGCRVEVASNGRHAVAQWEEGEFDLILMDCQMPELDGFEATREIRKREVQGERVPIIAITANVLDKDRTHCFAAGMDDFLSKPLRLTQLQKAVARWAPRRDEVIAAP